MTIRATLLLALAACGDDVPPFTPATLYSGAAQLDLAGDGSTLVLSRAGTTLLAFTARAFQAGTVDDLDAGDSFDPYWLFVDSPPAPPTGLAWHGADRLALVTATDTSLVVSAGDVQIAVQPAGADCFAATMTSRAPRTAYFRVAPDAGASEGFYGLGEWADAVDHRGTLRPAQIEIDTSLEGGDDENHVPVPFVVGTNGWGLFVATKRPGVFDVARQSATRIDVAFGTGADSASGLAFDLFTAAAPLDVLAHYFDVAGYPGLPAPWATGPLLWRNHIVDEPQVEADAQQIRNLHLATSGIWFDDTIQTGVDTLDFDPSRFPTPQTMLAALHAAGLRYGAWQAPYTSDPYATAHGFFPPTTGILLNHWGKPIDFTNPDAYAWWQQQVAAFVASYGFEGWKLDYGEDVVVGLGGTRSPWQFADGSDERTMHYGYQLLYHAVYRGVLAKDGAFVLARTGRWGDQTKGAIIWPGDLDASFAKQGDALPGTTTLAVGGLPAALTKGIGLSASGFPFYASDTGGYRGAPASKETWIRWVEASAVWPAMQTGDSASMMPWERDAESLADYARYASLHLRLYPYTWTYARAIATTGRPIVRPLGLAYPALGVHPIDEYLLGDAIVVAPVVAAGVTSRDVVLPPGRWLGWWDGRPYTGTTTAVADLDTLPLFVEEGAIVPMLRPTIDTLAPVAQSSSIDSFATAAGVLWVRVAPGPSATTFAVYDGTTLAQAPGSVSYAPGSVFAQGAMFEQIATPRAPSSVSTASGPLAMQPSLAALVAAGSGWFHDPAATGGTLWILIGGAASVTIAP